MQPRIAPEQAQGDLDVVLAVSRRPSQRTGGSPGRSGSRRPTSTRCRRTASRQARQPRLCPRVDGALATTTRSRSPATRRAAPRGRSERRQVAGDGPDRVCASATATPAASCPRPACRARSASRGRSNERPRGRRSRRMSRAASAPAAGSSKIAPSRKKPTRSGTRWPIERRRGRRRAGGRSSTSTERRRSAGEQPPALGSASGRAAGRRAPLDLRDSRKAWTDERVAEATHGRRRRVRRAARLRLRNRRPGGLHRAPRGDRRRDHLRRSRRRR